MAEKCPSSAGGRSKPSGSIQISHTPLPQLLRIIADCPHGITEFRLIHTRPSICGGKL
jgi:hypothetical protein